MGGQQPYKLAPGGDFEGYARGWTLAGGAKKVAGNESFHATGDGGSSVSIPAGGSVTTAPTA